MKTRADESEIRRLRLDGDQWSAVLERLRADTLGSLATEGSGTLGVVARHAVAPVRARLVAESGGRGSFTRLSILGDEVLLILQTTSQEDGRTLVEPGAELRLCTPLQLWAALQAGLPPVAHFRSAARASSDRRSAGAPPSSDITTSETASGNASGGRWDPDDIPVLLDPQEDESAGLLVTVEAWPTPGEPSLVWMRRWSVIGGNLMEVHRGDSDFEYVPRPSGSVAAELQWALAGAVGHVSG